MTRFIPLTPTDLESWMSDPEEWANEEDKENDHWEYELRVRRIVLSTAFLLSHFSLVGRGFL